MDTTANGVIARLVGVETPPPPSLLQEPFLVILLVILAVGALQALGIVRSVVLLSGGLALIWGVVLRPVLALPALRAQVTSGDADTLKQARVRVPA